MAAENVPAAPLEKLYLRMEQATLFGKEFDENLERRVLGLPEATGRDPIFIAANADRVRMQLAEDKAGAKELALEAKAASQTEQQRTIALLQAQLEQQSRQIAELKGQPVEAAQTTPQPPVPTSEPNLRRAAAAAEKAPVALPDGEPNSEWTRNQMYEWLKANSRPLPKNPVGVSKTAALDYTLGELAKMKEAANGDQA